MLQLIYISTARGPITPELCEDILAVSRRNNRVWDISGLLVAGRRRFLQALEGPDAEVRATYDRIAADPRHFACVLLAERQVDQRQFGDWAMAYTPSDEGGAGDDLQATVAALVAPIEDANLRAQFLGFAAIQSAA